MMKRSRTANTALNPPPVNVDAVLAVLLDLVEYFGHPRRRAIADDDDLSGFDPVARRDLDRDGDHDRKEAQHPDRDGDRPDGSSAHVATSSASTRAGASRSRLCPPTGRSRS